MAILKIARMGHPTLMGVAELVLDPTAPEIRTLVADMIETMADADGAGLAAPQVHVPLRVVIFHLPADVDAKEREEDEDGEGNEEREDTLCVLINPVIEPLSDELVDAYEGCLSLPGMRGVVSRPGHIRYRALGLDGETIEREATGFHARVVQHECDHLDGVLYPMRMANLATFGYIEEHAAARREEL